LRWHDADPAVLRFERDGGFGCLVNFGPAPVALPDGSTVLLASVPLDDDGHVPGDAAVWYERRPVDGGA
jgi:alpha-glucosidase